MTVSKAPIREEMFLTPGILSKVWAKFFVDVESLLTTLDAEDIADSVLGTLNQITVTDNGDGTVTLSLPQDIATTSSPEFSSITLSDLTASKLAGTDGDKLLESKNIGDFLAGTSNQVTVTNDGDGTATLSLPQDIDTGASPEFDGVQVAAETKAGNYTLTLDDTVILANPNAGVYTCTVSPTAGSDDGQMWAAGGGFTTATGSIRVGSNGFNIFVRCDSFSGDSLPQGAIITSAALVANGSNASDVDVIAYCEDADNAVAPTDDTSYNALSLTTGTAQTISGSGWQSVDITSEVQEVVDRVGYSAGQAIQVVIEDNGDADTQYFTSYDSGSNFPYISIKFNTSTQAITIPTSVITGSAGRPFLVVNTSSENSVDITTEGSETINGAASITLRNQYDAALIVPDGANVKVFYFRADINDYIDGTANQVIVTDDTDGTLTLSLPQDIDTGASPEFDGVQIATETKVGNYTLTLDDTIIYADPSNGEYTCTVSPADGADDGGGSQTIWSGASSPYLWVGGLGAADYGCCVRCSSFVGDSLPQGAVITSALLHCKHSCSVGAVPVTAQCEDADAGIMPTDTATWLALNLTTGTNQNLPASGTSVEFDIDLTDEVQEVVDRVGYSAGNAIMAVINDNGSGALAQLYSYNSGNTYPVLTVEFNSTTQTFEIPTDIITNNPGRPFIIVKSDDSAFTVDITTEGSETINGDATITLNNQYDAVVLIPDGTNVSAYFFHTRITNAMVTYLETLVADITQTNLVDKSATETISGSWTFTPGITLTNTTASRLLATNGDKLTVSVANLASWIAGTSNQVTVTDDADGTITLSTPQDINTTSGPTFGSLTVGDVTNQMAVATDGEITLAGTARVYQNMWFDIGSLKAPGTKPAAEVAWGISTAWEFTDGTDDTVGGEKRLPQDMDRTVNPEFKIGWASATADPGDDSKQVVWQLEYLYIALNEDTTAAAQETLTTTTSASTTVNGLTISTITGMDLPGASDQLIQIRVKRLGADGDDDLGDDCVLVGCGMKYVKNKLGVAL